MVLSSFREIRIENTNACRYKCIMCPRERQTRKIGCMSLEDFSLLLERFGHFIGIFHLHGYGEPLLDRQFIPKVKLLKSQFSSSKAMIFTTLGTRVPENFFLELIEAGLDMAVISLYGFTRDDYKKIHGYDGFDVVKQNLQRLSHSMKISAHAFSACIKTPSREISSLLDFSPTTEKMAFCNWVRELGFEINESHGIHNYGNGRSYHLPNRDRVCPVVNGNRKNILTITWDLNVIPCCYDFDATIRFGNLRKNSLEEIFSSPEYFNFIVAHQTNNLSAYPVCQNCEKKG